MRMAPQLCPHPHPKPHPHSTVVWHVANGLANGAETKRFFRHTCKGVPYAPCALGTQRGQWAMRELQRRCWQHMPNGNFTGTRCLKKSFVSTEERHNFVAVNPTWTTLRVVFEEALSVFRRKASARALGMVDMYGHSITAVGFVQAMPVPSCGKGRRQRGQNATTGVVVEGNIESFRTARQKGIQRLFTKSTHPTCKVEDYLDAAVPYGGGGQVAEGTGAGAARTIVSQWATE